jgi:TolB-like protein
MVLYFDNNSTHAEYDVLQKGLADMLITDLAGAAELQIVERAKLEQLLAELALQRSRFFDPATAQKMGRGVGARYAITGAFAAFEPDLRIDIRLVEVETGKVIMADQVTGRGSQFLALEQQLAGKFIAGLRAKLATPVTSGPSDISALLRYSKGLDAADRGEYRVASQTMAEVVRGDPGFKLAESRYAELLRRMDAAADRRTAEMSALEADLLAHTDKLLLADPKQLRGRPLCERLGARALRASLYAARISGLTRRASAGFIIPEAQQALAFSWMQEYAAQQQLLIDEMAICSTGSLASCGCGPYWLDLFREQDKAALKQISGNSLGTFYSWPGGEPHKLAEFLGRGISFFFGPFHPAPTFFDPHYGDVALGLFERALIEAERSDKPSETDIIGILDGHAETLVRMGRKMEAIARWQMILDKFPRSERFGEFETKMKKHLVPTREFQTLQALGQSCTASAWNAGSWDVERALWDVVVPTEGAPGVQRWLTALRKSCSRIPHAASALGRVAEVGAAAALLDGDCGRFRQFRSIIDPVAFTTGHTLATYMGLYSNVCR